MIALATTGGALAADAPKEIKLGALYASSEYSKISLPLHYGLKLWEGGLWPKPAFVTHRYH